MTRREEYELHKGYIQENGLDKLINFEENLDYEFTILDGVRGNPKLRFPPEAEDLVRLHKLVRSRKCFTITEFGCGYSTLILADALEKNRLDWEALEQKPEIRNRYMFQLFSVDTSQRWLTDMEERFPPHLKDRVTFSFSEVEIGKHNGQICHYFEKIPNVVSDFYYLDGPFTKDVKGSINGLSFDCEERTVMAADLLLMESTFLPGTFILVDGRVNNARFLKRNFTREYIFNYDKEGDVTTFELNEERLGKYNHLGSDFFQ